MITTDLNQDDGGVPLIVDVDGTLLRTDLLGEGVVDLARRTPWRMLWLPFWLARSKAYLKQRIADDTELCIQTMPVNDALLERLKLEKSTGRKLYLASAADRRHVEALSAHIGLFDGIFASEGGQNNAGPSKAELLVNAFGENGFDYAGNAAIDIPIWQRSRRAILVNAPRGVRQQLEAGGTETEELGSSNTPAKAYFLTLRPQQWLKNLLVFVPVLASHSMDPQAWAAATLAFFAFSLAASAVYVINDLLDLPHDRLHPRKCLRSLASGEIPLAHGIVLAPLLIVAASIIAGFVEGALLGALFAYLALTSLYSLYLKRIALLDVFTLATLYTSRIVAGGLATGIIISEWLAAFAIFLFLSLAIIKRFAELADARAHARGDPAGRGYFLDDLPLLGGLGAAAGYAAVVVLALYINSDEIRQLYSQPSVLWGICVLLMLWISRMLLLSHRGCMHDDPLVFAIRDPFSLVVATLAVMLFLLST